jgi:hypothetical protein
MTDNIFKLAPPGIDLRERIVWASARSFARDIRRKLEDFRKVYALHSDAYDVAAAHFAIGLDPYFNEHPKGELLRRATRAYVAHFRRELVAEAKYIEACTRRALLGR